MIIFIFMHNLISFVHSQNCYPYSTRNINHKFLTYHNAVRKEFKYPPLVLDFKLIEDSLQWSKHLAKDVRGITRSKLDKYGENIWMLYGPEFFNYKIENPLKDWYKEYMDYSFEDQQFDPKCANFTQMIWKRTNKIGCGVCSMNQMTFVTCRYQPKGNVVNDFLDNVPNSLNETTTQIPILITTEGVLYLNYFLGFVIFVVIIVIVVRLIYKKIR